MKEAKIKKEKAKKEKATGCSIGGQALLEGVMMRGRTAMALAVRGSNGDILLETQRLKPKSKAAKFPILRGVISFVSSLTLGMSVTMRAAEVLSDDEDEKLSKGAGIFAVFLGIILAVGLFIVLPMVLGDVFDRLVYGIETNATQILVKNLVSGALRLGIFVLYLWAMTFIKDIRRNFMYHGAEHRTINCFEKGLPLTVENVQKCSTKHNRCGTTFMFLVLLISIIVFAFADWGLSLIFPALEKGVGRTALFMGIKLLLLPVVAGISYEVLFLFAKMPDNWVAKVLRAPGLALQKLTTKIPDDGMAEVAIFAFNAVLDMENDQGRRAIKFGEISIERAKKEIEGVLNKLGAEVAEGAWLLCAVTGKKRSELGSLKFLTAKEYKKLGVLLGKRKEMPLDYCLGTSSFYGRDVIVDKRVLVPRMETETLCETAIKTIKAVGGEEKVAVLDLCTGSGCIALTLAKETHANVVAADVCADALAVAAENLKGTGVDVMQSDMFGGLNGRVFDIIVCNPPYVRSADIRFLQKEVRVQPRIALDGGEDGLDFYRILAKDSPAYLKEGGHLIVEVGFGQAEEVAAMFAGNGFERVEVIKDLQGVERVVKAGRG
ncbi:MAG: peptide chain release factor N(5)-glutamine methyltransferase [Firmicutes bacterium]|nr:peptide chain release factor N(5)-glutamine methyltransferase [Bacillota bacterium]